MLYTLRGGIDLLGNMDCVIISSSTRVDILVCNPIIRTCNAHVVKSAAASTPLFSVYRSSQRAVPQCMFLFGGFYSSKYIVSFADFLVLL